MLNKRGAKRPAKNHERLELPQREALDLQGPKISHGACLLRYLAPDLGSDIKKTAKHSRFNRENTRPRTNRLGWTVSDICLR